MNSSSFRRHIHEAVRLSVVGSVMLLMGSSAFGEAHPSLADAERQQIHVELENRKIVSEAFDTWRAGGNVFTTLLSPDVVWTIRGSGPVAGTYSGLPDFLERASRPLVDRLATPVVPDIQGIFADGDIVIVRFDGSATTLSGDPYRNQFVWIFRMQSGLVVEAEAFLDLTAYQAVIDSNQPRP